MRAVGALPTAGDQQLALPAQRQKRVEQQGLSSTGHEPRSELAEHRGVKARVGQLQAEQIFPVNPASDGFGRPPVRQVLGKLQHGDQRQAPRHLSGLSAAWKQGRELSIAEHRPKRVAQAQIGIAARKGGPRDNCRGSRNLGAGSRMKRHGGPPGLGADALYPERPTHPEDLRQFASSISGVEGSVRNPSTPGGRNGTETDPKTVYAGVQGSSGSAPNGERQAADGGGSRAR